ncbi:putative multiple RNA-binding domain-containing protein 1 [Cryptosporidium serpentis]
MSLIKDINKIYNDINCLRDSNKYEKSSTRLIIKNLPGYLTERRLREHFSSINCTITDVRIARKYSKDLKKINLSRRFGFVGFLNTEDAKKALEYFNGTFIDTSRITVEFALPPGSSDIPIPKSRYSQKNLLDMEDNKTNTKEIGNKNESMNFIINKNSNDKEFTELIRLKDNNRSWLDSVDILNNDMQNKKGTENCITEIIDVKPTKCGVNTVRKHTIFFDESTDDDSTGIEELDRSERNNIDDKEWIKLHTIDNNNNEDEDKKINNELNLDNIDSIDEQNKINIGDKIDNGDSLSSGRLMVLNFPYSTSEEDLIEYFSTWGEVKNTHIVKSERTGVSKGCGFVQFAFPEHAVRALSESHMSLFQGRIIRVSPALEYQPKYLNQDKINHKNIGALSSYKRKAILKKKEQAEDEHTWNLLYVSANSAIDAITDNMNIEKHDLVNVESSDLAVRVALAETSVISATKEWLRKEGIAVKTFEAKGTDLYNSKLVFDNKDRNIIRSSDTIILKHLPSEYTTIDDLQKICSPYGSINRLCLSPSRTIAIVQYLEDSSAAIAFKKLAFRRFKSAPLYLEWAPINIFLTNNDAEDFNKPEVSTIEQLEDTTCIFIKGLNFKTTEDCLSKIFGNISGFRKSTIIKKTINKDENQIKLSMGYGFLEFDTIENARECIKKMQGTVIDDHIVQLSMSKRDSKPRLNGIINLDSNIDKKISKISNKLLIKNLPFQASKDDVKNLFGAIGSVVSVRIPKKHDGTNRGYCFVEFLGKLEALAALEQLQHSHLYGRHLIIELAKDSDEQIDSIDENKKRILNYAEDKENFKKRYFD